MPHISTGNSEVSHLLARSIEDSDSRVTLHPRPDPAEGLIGEGESQWFLEDIDKLNLTPFFFLFRLFNMALIYMIPAQTYRHKPVRSLDFASMQQGSEQVVEKTARNQSSRGSHTERLQNFNYRYAHRHADQLIRQDIQSFKYDKSKFDFKVAVDYETAKAIYGDTHQSSTPSPAVDKPKTAKRKIHTRPPSINTGLISQKSDEKLDIEKKMKVCKPKILVTADNSPVSEDKEVIWSKLKQAISTSETTTQRARMIIVQETSRNTPDLLPALQNTPNPATQIQKVLIRNARIPVSFSDTKLSYRSAILHPKPWNESLYLKLPSLEKPRHRRQISENLDQLHNL